MKDHKPSRHGVTRANPRKLRQTTARVEKEQLSGIAGMAKGISPRQRFRCPTCGANGVRPHCDKTSCPHPCGASLILWPAGEKFPGEGQAW